MSLSNKNNLPESDTLQSAESQSCYDLDLPSEIGNTRDSVQTILKALGLPYYEMGDGLLTITPIWAIGDFGSFQYDLKNGHWYDSFTDSIGHSLISLIMYLDEMCPIDAAILMRNILNGGALRAESALPNRDLNLRYSIPRLTKQLISTKFGRFTKNLNY